MTLTDRNSTLTIDWSDEFDAIRGFDEHEAGEHIQSMVQDKDFRSILRHVVLELKTGPVESTVDSILTALGSARTIAEFQHTEKTMLERLMQHDLALLTTSGFDPERNDGPCLFVSNHRDIVLDPLLINRTLLESNLPACHLAIGDNLLVTETSQRLAFLNRCFAVRRSVRSPRALVAAMKVQSSYIRYLRFTRQHSVWLAQREGRSKDNRDQTNPALVKMLALAKPRNITTGSYLREMRIVPVSLSYEWDPCDIQKAQQLEAEENGTYQKSGMDDLDAVLDGVTGDKGRMHCAFDFTFHDGLDENASAQEIAEALDRAIYRNYRLYPVNFAALLLAGQNQLLEHTTQQVERPDPADIEQARHQLLMRVQGLNDAIKHRIINYYAQPLINFLGTVRKAP